MTVSRSVTWANADSVTVSDTTEIRATALWVGGAGDMSVETAGGDTVTFVGIQAGSLVPIEVKKVRSTSTTATDILALS